MGRWKLEYYNGVTKDWEEFTGRIDEVIEELNGHEEANLFIPNTSDNRTFVASNQIVRIYFDAELIYLGALFGVEYSRKRLKCIVYNGVYELMKRRVISKNYAWVHANAIMEEVRLAAGLINPLGSCPTTNLDINFDQTLCFDAMVEVAKACQCDYWTQNGDTLYLGIRGSSQSFDGNVANVSSRGIDRSKNRNKVHVRGFDADGEQIMGVAGSGDDVAVFWNNFATTEETLDYFAAKILAKLNVEDSGITLTCPITSATHLHPGDTITINKAELNLSGSYRIVKITKQRKTANIELSRAKRTTEEILEELSKTRNEVFTFTTFVSQFGGEIGPIGVGSTFIRSFFALPATQIANPSIAALATAVDAKIASPTVASIDTVVGIEVNPP
jgi:hypothetical protein